ncbi:oligosaccharide flippase family protein [Algoriphagus faecimaris]|nr:oligosaccharide flippase family protein [Algoriphagus faecimaris]
MSKSGYWLSSGFYSMLHRGIDFFVGFLGFMILVRIFSKEDFGVWVLFITIASIVEMARNGFIQNGMIKFVVGKENEELAKIQMSAIWLNTILTVLIIICLLTSASWMESTFQSPGLKSLINIHCLFLPLLIPHSHNLILMQGTFNFRSYFFAGISRSVPFFLIVVYFYLSKNSLTLIQLAWYFNLAFVFAYLSSQYQVRHQFRLVWGWHQEWISKIFHFGKFVFGTNLISMLTSSMDKFLLGALLSPIQVALANSAGRIINLLDIPINSISSISFPKASEASDQKNYVEVARIYEFTVASMFSFSLIFILFAVFFAKYIILIIAGEDYLEAVPYLQLISLVAVVKPLDRQAGVFLDAIGKPSYNMILVFGTLIYGLGLSWFFIDKLGLIGAAIGVISAIGLTALIKMVVLNRFLDISYKNILIQTIRNYPKAYKLAIARLSKKKSQ